MARLARLLRNDPQSPIDLEVKRILPIELDPAEYPVTHMTGTAKFLVKQQDCDDLQKYLNAGGTLIVDASGGNEAFTDSIREMLSRMYPDLHLAPLPPGHPLYLGRFAKGGGNDVQSITFRKYGELQLHEKVTEPAIEALTLNGRPAVLLSKYDITSGLLGTDTWGIIGYSSKSSVDLAENMIRFALDK